MEKNIIKTFISTEFNNLKKEFYYNSDIHEKNENFIYDYVLNKNIVNQKWFDNRLKYTYEEILKELLIKVM